MRGAGAGDVARRDKTEETHILTTHPSLVVAAIAAGPASTLFVVVQSVLDVIQVRMSGTTVVRASPVLFPPFVLFFLSAGSSKKCQVSRASIIVCCCLLYS